MSAQVILLAGPSGCGKSTLARRSGLPLLELDHFYFDHDHPGLPQQAALGMIDWDNIGSWDIESAMVCLHELCESGVAEVPQYDISRSRRTGSAKLDIGSAPCFIAEGIFASDLVQRCREEGILADAIVVQRKPWKNFVRRLARDLKDSRKPPGELWRRGQVLLHAEPDIVAGFIANGCRPLDARETAAALAAHLN